MVNEFLKWINYTRLRVTVIRMERALKKMELLYTKSFHSNDFMAFKLATKIDFKIQACQDMVKDLKARVESLR